MTLKKQRLWPTKICFMVFDEEGPGVTLLLLPSLPGTRESYCVKTPFVV